MRVNPDPSKFLGHSPLVNLIIEVVCDRFVAKFHSDRTAFLTDEPDVFKQQRIVSGTDPKTAHFRWASITQKKELRPGIRSQSQRRSRRRLVRARPVR